MPKTKLYSLTLCAALSLSMMADGAARADDLAVESERVTLAMILPALTGTELGALDIAAAPLPGETSVIRASDVKAKLRESGKDARGLAIPKSTRLVRHKRDLSAKELEQLIRTALAPRVAPCQIDQLSTLQPLTVAQGELQLEAEPMVRKQSGRSTAMIMLKQGERSQRFSVQTVLTCPEPVIMPGAQVRLVLHSGAVHVSAPGTAHQPGRVGDEIRVTNSLTKKSLMARVIDATSAEVIR
ncbi:MAG: Chaperone for flagella basal body P-ring formation [Myxococcaceae bacterium]|nr:Chaperone for flagella basal body P-ring formation [Myxococcaceae bacterium]